MTFHFFPSRWRVPGTPRAWCTWVWQWVCYVWGPSWSVQCGPPAGSTNRSSAGRRRKRKQYTINQVNNTSGFDCHCRLWTFPVLITTDFELFQFWSRRFDHALLWTLQPLFSGKIESRHDATFIATDDDKVGIMATPGFGFDHKVNTWLMLLWLLGVGTVRFLHMVKGYFSGTGAITSMV